jgi:hypothetical protein
MAGQNSQWAIEDILRQANTGEAIGRAPLSRQAISNTLYPSLLADREDAFNRAREQNRFNESVREFNVQSEQREEAMDIQKDAAKNQMLGNAVSGVGSLAVAAPIAYKAAVDSGLIGGAAVAKGGGSIGGATISGTGSTVTGGTVTGGQAIGTGESAVTYGSTQGTVTGATTAGGTTGGATAGGLTGTAVGGIAAGGVAGGTIGSMGARALGDRIPAGGQNERSIGGGIVGGAAAGAAIGVWGFGVAAIPGAIIGGIIGGITAMVENDSVICTELHRQGLISNDIYKAESKFGNSLDIDTIRGYHLWAKPIVSKMRKSESVTKLVYHLAYPVLQEMAHRASNKYKGNILGKLILKIGIPVCTIIGKRSFVCQMQY